MKFTTTLEAVSSNKSKTTIKLSMSNATARSFTANFLNSIDKDLIVTFDDPQMEMDMQPASGGRGLVSTVDQGGVVQSARRDDDGDEDEDQAELFDQDGDPHEVSEEDLVDGDEPIGDDQPGEEEVKFDDGDAAESTDETEEDDSEENGDDAAELDAEEIEAYILAEEPAFDAIPFNFPEMIRRVRTKEVRWMDLARESGIPSTKLQSIYRKYRELVAEQMKAQGVA